MLRWQLIILLFFLGIGIAARADAVRQLKPAGIAVKTQGTVTRVVCSYPQGLTFVHRTKQQCRVEGSGNCEVDPSACTASCGK